MLFLKTTTSHFLLILDQSPFLSPQLDSQRSLHFSVPSCSPFLMVHITISLVNPNFSKIFFCPWHKETYLSERGKRKNKPIRHFNFWSYLLSHETIIFIPQGKLTFDPDPIQNKMEPSL